MSSRPPRPSPPCRSPTQSPSAPPWRRPSRSATEQWDRGRGHRVDNGTGEKVGDRAGEKVRESLQAISVAQSAIPELQAALVAGRAPSADDLGKLARAASAFAEAAEALGLEPGRATL